MLFKFAKNYKLQIITELLLRSAETVNLAECGKETHKHYNQRKMLALRFGMRDVAEALERNFTSAKQVKLYNEDNLQGLDGIVIVKMIRNIEKNWHGAEKFYAAVLTHAKKTSNGIIMNALKNFLQLKEFEKIRADTLTELFLS